MGKNLFSKEEMSDKSPYALKRWDTVIVKASKLFVKRTIFNEDTPAGLMGAFQAGAEEARKEIVRIHCKSCLKKSECKGIENKEDICDFYNNVLKLFKNEKDI
ncbi:hypothetical protein PF672P1_00021 [Parabacteroides phage PF672P1]|nr:hypothetical protein PF672P1_00021 [Parabacteroides phage PF672P1]